MILVVGVNGSGKTTTIGKLAQRLCRCGSQRDARRGDTFRAAAVEQLQVWATRTGSALVAQQAGADPAAVVFDAAQSARSRGIDVLIADTAGRLQSQSHLMEELKKVRRVIQRVEPSAPHEVLLVLDANQGQNALTPGGAVSPGYRRHWAGADQARWHGQRRHRARHCPQAETADPLHRHRRTGRGLRRVQCRGVRRGAGRRGGAAGQPAVAGA